MFKLPKIISEEEIWNNISKMLDKTSNIKDVCKLFKNPLLQSYFSEFDNEKIEKFRNLILYILDSKKYEAVEAFIELLDIDDKYFIVQNPKNRYLNFIFKTGCKEIINLFLENGKIDCHNPNLFFDRSYDPEILKLFIDNRYYEIDKVHQTDRIPINKCRTIKSRGKTDLFLACSMENKIKLVENLLDNNADPNFSTSNGVSCLMNTSCEEIARLLIDVGADINHIDNHGKTVLMYIADKQDIGFIHTMVDLGADINQETPENGNVVDYIINRSVHIDDDDLNWLSNDEYQKKGQFIKEILLLDNNFSILQKSKYYGYANTYIGYNAVRPTAYLTVSSVGAVFTLFEQVFT